MPKKQERNSEEWYKGQIRELQKEVRQLRKQLKSYEKYSRAQDEEFGNDTEDTMPKNIKPVVAICHECGKGKLSTFEIVGRIFETCNICEYRKKIN